VVHVHLSDFNGEQHRRPEDGGLPLVSFLRALARNAYEGTVSLELCPEALHAEDPGRVLSHLRGALTFCRQHLSTEDQK
jgi:sugar phosphate isomerase/epimerase